MQRLLKTFAPYISSMLGGLLPKGTWSALLRELTRESGPRLTLADMSQTLDHVQRELDVLREFVTPMHHEPTVFVVRSASEMVACEEGDHFIKAEEVKAPKRKASPRKKAA